MLTYLAEKGTETYWAAVQALAGRHNSAVLEPLLEAVKDRDDSRRCWALSNLRHFSDVAAAHAAITAALKDSDRSVRQCAADVLKAENEHPKYSPVFDLPP